MALVTGLSSSKTENTLGSYLFKRCCHLAVDLIRGIGVYAGLEVIMVEGATDL